MSKFKEIGAFETRATDGYKLLPFRFSNYDENQYFVSNDVGDWVLLDRNTLHAFVRGGLDSQSSDYKDLKAKNFLSDSNDNLQLSLLALRARTKYQHLSEFTSLHAFVVSLRCEHSCPYCQVSRRSDDKDSFDMSKPTADKAIELMFQSPSKNISVEFQGGESLLNFDLITHIVEQCEQKNTVFNKNLQFVIATNLALITEGILDYCRDHRILISTSLDGPEKLHNKNRPRPGNDSYERTIAGIHLSKRILGDDNVSALMTTSKDSLEQSVDIINEYVKLGFSGIFLRPLSPYGFAVKTKWFDSYDMDEWMSFYKEGLNYILELNKQGYDFKEYYASLILTKLLTPFETKYVDLMSPAGAGISAVVYNYDGDVYASDESRMLAEMGDKQFLIGNVHKNTYQEIFTSDTLLEALEESYSKSVPMCSDCSYEPFCGSDPVFHYATQGNVVGKKPLSAFCKRNMEMIKYLVGLMESDIEIREILMGWVR